MIFQPTAIEVASNLFLGGGTDLKSLSIVKNGLSTVKITNSTDGRVALSSRGKLISGGMVAEWRFCLAFLAYARDSSATLRMTV
ncbi:MAG: hypothetical protein LUI60_04710 [Clostridia bacterium]|nr:hypothetical protein [Clostridia bacterium]